jgi:hypothetical protein
MGIYLTLVIPYLVVSEIRLGETFDQGSVRNRFDSDVGLAGATCSLGNGRFTGLRVGGHPYGRF